MAVLKLENFGGMVPAVDDRLLPPSSAALSKNTWLYSGALTGMVKPTSIFTCVGGLATSKVFRIPNNQVDSVHFNDSTWMEFQDANTDVIRAPVVGDSFQRYYWVGPNQIANYNTLARIQAGSASYVLGIPTPSSTPTLALAGGVSTITEARAYVVTYVSAYGEEGPPSPPTATTTGKIDDTWTVTLPVPGGGDLANRNLATKNIYRTVVGTNGIATFLFVANVAYATTTYADSALTTAISGNQAIKSTGWVAPPTDLQGWVIMPNGMVAAWRSNEVWFCEPYRPHAWPAAYAIAVDFPIVGLGVVGQTLVICTTASPWTATGTNPSTMSLSKIQAYEPCTARGSIISAPEGVYYSSQNGLVLVAAGQVVNITQELITKDKWQSFAPLTSLRAARLGTAYYAFGSRLNGCFDTASFYTSGFEQSDYTGSYQGVLISASNPRVAFNLVSNVLPASWVGNDPWTGEVFIVREGIVYWLNIGNSNPTYESYLWRSKIIQAPARENYAAARVYFSVPPTTPTQNPVRNTSTPQVLANDQYAILRLYADGILVLTRELRTSGELVRLPSGFRSDFWQVEIEGRVTVLNYQMATSVKELEGA